ncbi:hypothetical protein [Nonomuraea aridisoli]|uniref:Uncharacterized protein n=1 Tax=Nonomuraea aridisoli TaxID=2070368 RepID=A0A2W2F6B0_9ACTN|nr:hypothetical protein [Nonomuraea aridisoli]PZG20628.1 hypothetical protein C1J01_08995 [Nonomuraea aridisoli]
MNRSKHTRERAASPAGADVIEIVGGLDPDAPTDCLISWRGQDWTATVDVVRATAVDLFTVASWADVMVHVTVKLGLDPNTASRFTGELIVSQTGRRAWGYDETLSLLPVGSTKDKRGLVLIRRGHLKGVLSTDEARQMGLAWLVAAEAAESDQLVAEALRTAGGMPPDRIDGLFAYLRELRADHGGDHE